MSGPPDTLTSRHEPHLAAADEPPMTRRARALRVLNVNDDDGARRYKSALLTAAGFAVSEAARVAAARRLIATECPDLILLDVNLPDGNGVELCRELQPSADTGDAFEGDRAYAIVLISAQVTQPDDIARGMAAGADAYLVEPLDDSYLVGLLRSLAHRHARRRAVAQERAALRVRDPRYRILSATVDDAVYEWDFTTDRVDWSEGLCRVFGYAEGSAGHTAQWRLDRIHADDRARVADEIERVLAAQGASWEIELRFARGNGQYALAIDRATILYATDGTPLRAIGVVRDVTERRQLLDQLRLAQKMEALGQLAGGIAHDFNNVLTSVIGFTGLIKHEVSDRPSVVKHANEIESAAHRASEMVAQLMAFSRHREMTPEVLNLNEILLSSAGMLDRLIGAHIRIERDLATCLPTVRCGRAQIEQVILNLVVNARDAMPNGGRLLVTTGTVTIRPADRMLPPGEYVKLSVADTGIGMDEQTRSRIFEPFFTTKERGGGTGLGLSTVYGIVRQSGGHICVTTAPGAGATFDVLLPALDLPVSATPAAPAAGTYPSTAGATVLVVEDEPSVRRLACEVLTRAGYEVLHAADGIEGLMTAQAHDRRIDLLLTDLVLPGLSGVGLAQAFRTCHPEGRVLYMTGYTCDAGGPEALTVDNSVVLAKPFSRDELLCAVRERIEDSAPLPPTALV
jgi:PAS domain S-box-containing protein